MTSDWITCPHCGKKYAPLSPDAVIIGQQFKCRGSKCKRLFLCDTSTGNGIKSFAVRSACEHD